MSVGGLVGGLLGGVAGFMLAGPLGVTAGFGMWMGVGLGAGIGMMVDPIDMPSGMAVSPTDLQMTTTKRGTILAEFHGATKLNGTIIWAGGSHSRAIKSSGGGGKK